jgi:hypothetical protein
LKSMRLPCLGIQSGATLNGRLLRGAYFFRGFAPPTPI